MIKNCYMRHENGNCLPAGGFCTANKSICEALHNAYEMGKSEQRTGNWIKITNTLYKCDQCGAVQLKGNYCKDCGAKMEGANNDT